MLTEQVQQFRSKYQLTPRNIIFIKNRFEENSTNFVLGSTTFNYRTQSSIYTQGQRLEPPDLE